MKKYVTKTALLFLSVLFLGILTGCGTSPESYVTEQLDRLKNISSSDVDELGTFSSFELDEMSDFYHLYDEFLSSVDSDAPVSEEYKALLLAFFSEFDYEITDSTRDRKTASVNVTVTNYDMEIVLRSAIRQMAEKMITENLDVDEMTSLEQLNMTCEFVIAELDKATELSQTEVTINLNRRGREWEIALDDDTLDGLYSNFLTISADPFLLSADDFVSITFDLIMDMDTDNFIEFTDMDSIIDEEEGLSYDFMYELCRNTLEMFSYEIIDVSGENYTSTVTVKTTCLDFNALNTALEDNTMALASDTSLYNMTESQIMDKINDVFLETVKSDSKSTEVTVELNMFNDGDGWSFLDESQMEECFFGTILN